MNWKWATLFNVIPYIIGNIGGTLFYIYISPSFMIISTVTIFPLVYMIFAYLYYLATKYKGGKFFDKEWKALTVYWIGLSICLDAMFWMFILPLTVFPFLVLKYTSHIDWSFFIHEAHYLWANYLSIILITIAGKGAYVFIKHKKIRRGKASNF